MLLFVFAVACDRDTRTALDPAIVAQLNQRAQIFYLSGGTIEPSATDADILAAVNEGHPAIGIQIPAGYDPGKMTVTAKDRIYFDHAKRAFAFK